MSFGLVYARFVRLPIYHHAAENGHREHQMEACYQSILVQEIRNNMLYIAVNDIVPYTAVHYPMPHRRLSLEVWQNPYSAGLLRQGEVDVPI